LSNSGAGVGALAEAFVKMVEVVVIVAMVGVAATALVVAVTAVVTVHCAGKEATVPVVTVAFVGAAMTFTDAREEAVKQVPRMRAEAVSKTRAFIEYISCQSI
jgi:hypothetical protein